MKRNPVKPTISVIGGDERSVYLAKALRARGYDAAVCALGDNGLPRLPLKNALNRRLVILPLPASRDGITLNAPLSESPVKLVDIIKELHPHTVVMAGKPSAQLKADIESEGVRIRDYYSRDDVQQKNAVLTSEGAVAMLVENTVHTINKSKCLVVGCGRCGRMIALLLKKIGAHVCVSARKKRDYLWTLLHGMKPVRTADIDSICNRYDVIVNTVPVMIFDASALSRMRNDALLMDISGGCAGTDTDAAGLLGKTAIYAPGLPGKYSPLTAAEILCDAVIDIYTEEFS